MRENRRRAWRPGETPTERRRTLNELYRSQFYRGDDMPTTPKKHSHEEHEVLLPPIDRLKPPFWKGVAFALGMGVLLLSSIIGIAYFGGQTPSKELALEVVAENLSYPIQFDMAADGRIFFNEFVTGNVRIIQDGILLEEPFTAVDIFVEAGATGLTGIAIQEPYVYVFYTFSRLSGEGTCYVGTGCTEPKIVANRVSRFLMDGNAAGGEEEVILDYLPTGKHDGGGWDHFGGILKFGPDDKLYVSVGDATDMWAAQDMDRLNGKILRINPNGSIPDDNPFPGSPIFVSGTRNVWGMDFVLDTLYFTDNGPVDHDEINMGVAGGNYGWPYRAGNVSYAGDSTLNFIDPLVDLTPAIAPTGIAGYDGNKLGGRHNIFFGASLDRNLKTVQTDDLSWYVEDVLYTGISILGMLNGPDGFLYFSTFDRILRLVLT